MISRPESASTRVILATLSILARSCTILIFLQGNLVIASQVLVSEPLRDRRMGRLVSGIPASGWHAFG